MSVLGVAVRIERGAFKVGFVLVEGTDLLHNLSLPAPRDAGEHEQLAELHGRTTDVIGEWKPEEVALFVSGSMTANAALTLELHASGVVMAAVAARGVPLSLWRRPSLVTAAGLARNATTAEVLEALCSQLDSKVGSVEEKRACSAARAAVLGRDG